MTVSHKFKRLKERLHMKTSHKKDTKDPNYLLKRKTIGLAKKFIRVFLNSLQKTQMKF